MGFHVSLGECIQCVGWKVLGKGFSSGTPRLISSWIILDFFSFYLAFNRTPIIDG